MTFSNIILTFIDFIILYAICVGFYYEDRIAVFERKAARYVKCFFLACYYYAKEKLGCKEHKKADKKSNLIKMNTTAESKRTENFCRKTNRTKSSSKTA